MIKNNWNYSTSEQSAKALLDAFLLDLQKVPKKYLKLMLKQEHRSLDRKNAIYDKAAVAALHKFLIDRKPRKRIFLLRKLMLSYCNLPHYIAERNRLAMFYTNYAKKHSKDNEELYNNLIIGIISGIDAFDPYRGATLQSVIVLYAKKHANLDFDYDYRYPFRASSITFHNAKNYNIKLYESVSYDEEVSDS